jgi:hypothetical protein
LKTEHIAEALRARQSAVGRSAVDVARLSGCGVLEASQVLAGDPAVAVGVLVAVAGALGYDVLTVSKAPARAVAAGPDVAEPKVETVVSAALRQLTLPASAPVSIVDVLEMNDGDDESVEAALQAARDWSAGRVVDAEELDWASSDSAIEERWRQGRRLALHRAAARLLEEHPARAERALQVIERWTAAGFPNEPLVQEWRRIIESRQWGDLLEDTQRGNDLRKGSPFGFVLDDDERIGIIRHFAQEKENSRF